MALGFTPGGVGSPSSEVQLTLSCRHLRNMDVFSKSDPMVVVSMHNPVSDCWQVVGRTEMIPNNLNPDFGRKIVLEYHFEMQQRLKFDVYDIDSPNLDNFKEHDFLGSATASLGNIVSCQKLSLPLGVKRGELLILAEELDASRKEAIFALQVNVNTRSIWAWFTESEAYLEIHKMDESGDFSLVFRSEASYWSRPLSWQPIKLPLQSLCNGDLESSIRIRCFGVRLFGAPHLIGEALLTVNELGASFNTQLPLTHHTKKHQTGWLTLVNYEINQVYSFLEYVMGGMQIHCTVAIDFTSSNGNPFSDSSLHHFGDGPNPYEQALRAVVGILQDYDSDRQFPVLGFGARIPPHGHVSHDFFVNLQPESPYCSGVEGVLAAYKSCLRQVQLYGPTNFTPVIDHVTRFARVFQDGSQYFILLIITDGAITDMMNTKKAIIAASNLPLSIIIVGVGAADFSAMSELDSDEGPLSACGRAAARDIVQFVAFRDFQGIPDPVTARTHLAKEVLLEIPDQVIGFMKSHGIAPKKPSAPTAPPDPSASFGTFRPQTFDPSASSGTFRPQTFDPSASSGTFRPQTFDPSAPPPYDQI